jgi:hypothetical protein
MIYTANKVQLSISFCCYAVYIFTFIESIYYLLKLQIRLLGCVVVSARFDDGLLSFDMNRLIALSFIPQECDFVSARVTCIFQNFLLTLQ